jgi:predicted RecA/RadA family phage recombinase
VRNKVWIAMAVALAASVLASSAQETVSTNVFAFIRKTLPAYGKLIAVSVPLNKNLSRTNLIFGETSIADEAPLGSVVYFWDEVLQVWSGGSKSIIGWSPAQANRVIAAGEGFFLKGKEDAAADVEVMISGRVPMEYLLNRDIIGNSSLGALANPYPIDFVFGTSAIASNAALGSVVYFWDEALQVWSGGSKSIIGWSPAQANRIILAAEGFFLRDSGAGSSWDESKPYTWP